MSNTFFEANTVFEVKQFCEQNGYAVCINDGQVQMLVRENTTKEEN